MLTSTLGPRFVVSAEGLLWGIESAQTLTPGNVVPSRRTEPSRKRSPIRVAVTLDPALPRLPEREVSIPEKGSWLSFFLPAAGYRGRRNTPPPHTHTSAETSAMAGSPFKAWRRSE